MKKYTYILSVIIVLVICYILVNFFFFDKWVGYSSEKKINNYIAKQDTKSLNKISANHKTSHFLKNTQKVSITLLSDNQGSDDKGYYSIEINNKPAHMVIKINHPFLPETPELESIKLEDHNNA
ncbi:hypothetical protein [Staphylococcus auricularis]|uniref:Lipoprotein n=1 Tax=Staphylococcus auricularis TaxID=29379 RepID=A0ABX5IDR8_9STAP|nr:hypothetical protein [Staphylococcus auricularis]PTH13253.1 hypothetical protein BU607_09805 [Staphylococcus auricularis]PTH25360.1 hypothetical protein BU608_07885 [Staphylococcus auricularis]